MFDNSKVGIDTSLSGLDNLAGSAAPAWLTTGFQQLDVSLKGFTAERHGLANIAAAHKLAPIYRDLLELDSKVNASNMDAQVKANLRFELAIKVEEFQSTLKDLLGLDLMAFTTKAECVSGNGPFPGGSADETPRSVTPGEEFRVRVHTGRATTEASLSRVWLESTTGDEWNSENTSGAD